MSVWIRLFGQSESAQSKSKPRLGLESLEAREVPAIVFVGGWGASSYQYATDGTHASGDAVPTDQFSLNFAKVTFDTRDAADYSAIVFVGGWGGSAPQSGPNSLMIEAHCVRHAVELRRGEMIDLFVTSQAQAEHAARPLPVLMVLADQQDFYYSTTGGSGRDVLLGGQTVDDTADPTTVADDVVVDGRIITGENYDSAAIASSGYIRVKKLNSGG